MRLSIVPLTVLLGVGHCAEQFLKDLPADFANSSSGWAWVSYDSPNVAVIPGAFNRSAFDAPHEGNASNSKVAEASVTFILHQHATCAQRALPTYEYS